MKLVGVFKDDDDDPGCGYSCFFIKIPDSLNLENESKEWIDSFTKWKTEVYYPAMDRNQNTKINHLTFEEWLISKGAILATDDDIIFFDEP